MGILPWIILGLIAGVVGNAFMPGRNSAELLLSIIIGIVGAILGGYIGSLVGLGIMSSFDIRSFVVAIGCATILLLSYRAIKRRATRLN